MDHRPVVVLLHGLARSQLSMRGLANFLEAQGFATWTWTWPSRSVPVAEAARQVQAKLLADLGLQADGPLPPICAVTHSLGGIVALQLSQRVPLHRAVLLAPPVRGSRVAKAFVDWKLFHWFYGPAGMQVAQPPPDWHAPGEIGALGVIAGTQGLHWSNPVSWATRALGVLPAGLRSDGTVAADETRPPQAHDYAEVQATHTWIMDDPQVRKMVVSFLQSGGFGPP